MTTFLHTPSWLNWVNEDDDEDEVGLKDTRYIKNTGNAGKGRFPTLPLLGLRTLESAGASHLKAPI